MWCYGMVPYRAYCNTPHPTSHDMLFHTFDSLRKNKIHFLCHGDTSCMSTEESIEVFKNELKT